MLKRFTVRNYKNFKDEISLDFSKIGEYSFNEDCLSMRLIYGRNTTGKTNFGRALLDIKTLLYGMFRNDENSVLINADSQKDTAKFILKAQSARGIYFFRIRSYCMVKGKKIYSAYSEERKVRFD